MPGRCWVAAVCVLGAAGTGWAGDPPGGPAPVVPAAPTPSTPLPPPTRVPEYPPLGLPAADGPGMPGVPVSRPLQPVQLTVPPPPAPEVEKTSARVPTEADMMKAEVARPLGQFWETLEYLVWWPKSQPLPPLVTAGRGPSPPVAGGPNTLILVGGSPIDSPDVSGARFAVGFAVNEDQTAGLAVTYLFLGTRTSTADVTDVGVGRTRLVGRPIVNAVSGQSDVIPVAIPGSLHGAVEASTTDRVTGWEITGVANLYAGPQLRLNALAGYRYFMVNEGLRIDQTALFAPPPTGGLPILASLADQFDAHNRFHGGQLGLSADVTRGPVFVEATGKVALGEAISVVSVSGQSVAVPLGFPPQWPMYFPNGVLAQPTNSGRFVRTAFAVLPEAVVKVGYRFQDRSRLYVGYNFIYLSEAVRPGDQIDPTVDPSQVPLFGRTGGAVAERPVPVLARSDFWVQGLIFGLEYRY